MPRRLAFAERAALARWAAYRMPSVATPSPTHAQVCRPPPTNGIPCAVVLPDGLGAALCRMRGPGPANPNPCRRNCLHDVPLVLWLTARRYGSAGTRMRG
jgi:hypothetical protein